MTRDLSSVIHQIITSCMSSIFTAVPGIVQKYDKAKKIVSALPAIKMKFADGTLQSMPIITNVPVIFPGTRETVIQYPLKRGDGCLLIFSSESLERWILGEGAEADPGDSRRFALTDAFCIPGLFPPRAPGKVAEGNDLEIAYKNSTIHMTDSTVELNGNSKSLVTWAELNTALQALVTAINEHIHPDPISGVTGTPAAPLSIDISASKTEKIVTGG